MIYKVYILRKLVISADDESLLKADGARICKGMEKTDTLAIIILNTEFELTVNRVRRLERLLGGVFGEKVLVIW